MNIFQLVRDIIIETFLVELLVELELLEENPEYEIIFFRRIFLILLIKRILFYIEQNRENEDNDPNTWFT